MKVGSRVAALAALWLSLSLAGCSSGEHCTQNSDCATGRVCASSGFCETPGQCGAGVQSCTRSTQCPAKNECANNCCTPVTGCVTSADCTTAALPHCDAATKTCKPCSSNGDCQPGRVCTGAGTCEQSCNPTNNGSDCPSGAGRCKTIANGAFCGQCASSPDCPSDKPICTGGGICFGCTQDADCPTGTPACNVTTKACFECLDTRTSNGVNASCAAPKPACRNNSCVECNAALNNPGTGQNAACTTAGKNVCDANNTCVGCTSTPQCASGQFCDTNKTCRWPVLVSVVPTASSISVNSTTVLTVTLDIAALVQTNVALTVVSPGDGSFDPANTSKTGTATIAAGNTTGVATFYSHGIAGPNTIEATLGGVTKTTTVTILAQPPTASSLSIAGNTTGFVQSGVTQTIQLRVAPAPGSPTSVPLKCVNGSGGTVACNGALPASVSVAAGTDTATFDYTPGTSGTSSTIRASLNGAVDLSLASFDVAILALTPPRTVIGPVSALYLQMDLAAAPPGPAQASVVLDSNIAGNGSLVPYDAGNVTLPVTSASVNIAAGDQHPRFNVYTGPSGSTAVAIRATANATFQDTSVTLVQPPAHVVVSQFMTAGPILDGGPSGSADEFIEIYNPTNHPIDLGGKIVSYRAATGAGFTNDVCKPDAGSGITIPPYGYFLVANATGNANNPGYAYQPNGPVAPDCTYLATSGQFAGINSGGHIRVFDAGTPVDAGFTTAGVDDTMAWGTASSPETTAIPTDGGFFDGGSFNQPFSWIRKTVCGSSTSDSMSDGGTDDGQGQFCDSDNNSTDWTWRPQRKPHNSTMKAPPNALAQ